MQKRGNGGRVINSYFRSFPTCAWPIPSFESKLYSNLFTSLTVYFFFSLPTGFADDLSFMYYNFLEEGVAKAKLFN